MRRGKRPALFSGYWSDPVTGTRGRRVTRAEMREVWRLWRVHTDVRTGRVKV